MAKLKLGILISGRGSNMQALAAACAGPDFPAEVALVLSNNAAAGGLALARQAGIATAVIDHRGFDDRDAFDVALDARLTEAGVQLVCLAGFMRLLGAGFVTRWRDRLINIHPSLLPAFKGLHVHERMLETGVRIAGCTVHFVRPEMDDGPIITQAAVTVSADDTPATLAARILRAEHEIYPEAVRLIAEGRTRVSGERVEIRGRTGAEGALFNPPAE